MKHMIETPTSSMTKSDLQFLTPGRKKISRDGSQILTPFTNQIPLKKCCNCEKSRCIKLYCDCYAAGVYCDGCNCIDCQNVPSHEDSRKKAIQTTLEKNPTAFQSKITANELELKLSQEKIQPFAKHNKGCNCRKSSCMKKYCECYQAGIPCTDLCKCFDCKNIGYIPRTGNVMGRNNMLGHNYNEEEDFSAKKNHKFWKEPQAINSSVVSGGVTSTSMMSHKHHHNSHNHHGQNVHGHNHADRNHFDNNMQHNSHFLENKHHSHNHNNSHHHHKQHRDSSDYNHRVESHGNNHDQNQNDSNSMNRRESIATQGGHGGHSNNDENGNGDIMSNLKNNKFFYRIFQPQDDLNLRLEEELRKVNLVKRDFGVTESHCVINSTLNSLVETYTRSLPELLMDENNCAMIADNMAPMVNKKLKTEYFDVNVDNEIVLEKGNNNQEDDLACEEDSNDVGDVDNQENGGREVIGSVSEYTVRKSLILRKFVGILRSLEKKFAENQNEEDYDVDRL